MAELVSNFQKTTTFQLTFLYSSCYTLERFFVILYSNNVDGTKLFSDAFRELADGVSQYRRIKLSPSRVASAKNGFICVVEDGRPVIGCELYNEFERDGLL